MRVKRRRDGPVNVGTAVGFDSCAVRGVCAEERLPLLVDT